MRVAVDYFAQSSPNAPMPGQSPPTNVVAFTVGPALGTVVAGVVDAAEAAKFPAAVTTAEPPTAVPVCTVTTPIAASAEAPHMNMTFDFM